MTKSLNELFGEWETERLAEIEQEEAKRSQPENEAEREARLAAELKRDIRLGIRNARGEFIETECDEHDEDQDEDEDGEEEDD